MTKTNNFGGFWRLLCSTWLATLTAGTPVKTLRQDQKREPAQRRGMCSCCSFSIFSKGKRSPPTVWGSRHEFYRSGEVQRHRDHTRPVHEPYTTHAWELHAWGLHVSGLHVWGLNAWGLHSWGLHAGIRCTGQHVQGLDAWTLRACRPYAWGSHVWGLHAWGLHARG